MTLFDLVETNEHLAPVQVANIYLEGSNAGRGQDEFIRWTTDFFEMVYNSWASEEKENEDFYNQYIQNNQLTDELRKVLLNTPPLINPELEGVSLEELPQAALAQYKDLMGIEDRGDYYAITKPLDVDYYIRMNKQFPFIKKVRDRTGVFFEDKIEGQLIKERTQEKMESLIPHETVAHDLDTVFGQATERDEMFSEDVFRRHFKKDDFNHAMFMRLYYFYFHDLLVRTFYQDEYEYFERLTKVQFMEPERGEYTFADLKDLKVPNATMQGVVKAIYYNARQRGANKLAGQKLKRPVDYYSFSFEADPLEAVFKPNLELYGEILKQTIYTDNQERILNNMTAFERLVQKLKDAGDTKLLERIERFVGIGEENMDDLKYIAPRYFADLIHSLEERRDKLAEMERENNQYYAWLKHASALRKELEEEKEELTTTLAQEEEELERVQAEREAEESE